MRLVISVMLMSACVLCTGSTVIHAEETVNKSSKDGFQERRGPFLGLSYGVGLYTKSTQHGGESGPATALWIQAGYTLRPNLAILASLSTESDFAIKARDIHMDQTAYRFEGMYWYKPRWWVRGGLGIAHYGGSCDDMGTNCQKTYMGAQLSAAAGVELLHRSSGSISLETFFVSVPSYNLGDTGSHISSYILGIAFSANFFMNR